MLLRRAGWPGRLVNRADHAEGDRGLLQRYHDLGGGGLHRREDSAIDATTDYSLDFDFDYFVFKALEKSYLLRVYGSSWSRRSTCSCASLVACVVVS